jgi:hypothetical protein
MRRRPSSCTTGAHRTTRRREPAPCPVGRWRTASTFGGPVSYASGIWEEVDWSGFDVVGTDGYRDEQNAPYYRQMLAQGHRHGKPVVVTEFGCCTYRGAGARGGTGWMVGDPTADPTIRPGTPISPPTQSWQCSMAATVGLGIRTCDGTENGLRRDGPAVRHQESRLSAPATSTTVYR